MTAKEMQEQFLKNNEVKVCPTYDYGISHKSGRVAEYDHEADKKAGAFKGSVKTLTIRRFEQRDKKICKNCGEEFIPRVNNVMGVKSYSKECYKCRKTTKFIKDMVRRFKSWDKCNEKIADLEALKSQFKRTNEIDMDNVLELKNQISIRKKILEITDDKNYQRAIPKLSDRLEELTNSDLSITGYKFDF